MKNFAKHFAQNLALVLALPLAGAYFVFRRFAEPRTSFRGFSELVSLLPGVSGRFLRTAFYRLTLENCSPESYIGFGTLLASPEVSIGHNVYVGSQCSLGCVSIGSHSLLASGVRVISGLHQHDYSRNDIPIREQEGTFTKITIGKDCWVGEGAILAADIGDHSIVAAGSVVFSPVPEYSIVRGNPAVVVKTRTHE